jgi:hypothetical protein
MYRDLRRNQRCSESAQRLRDDHRVDALANRVHELPRVLGQARVLVVAGQVYSNRLVPRLL